MPEVVGVRLVRRAAGRRDRDRSRALTVTEMLRKNGVVGRFVEFCGAGLSNLALADRATISNMAPEYGATASLFPVDDETLRYLRLTGRTDEQVELVERYCKAQRSSAPTKRPIRRSTTLLELDLAPSSRASPDRGARRTACRSRQLRRVVPQWRSSQCSAKRRSMNSRSSG